MKQLLSSLKTDFQDWLNSRRELLAAKRRNRKLLHAITVANELTRQDRLTRYVLDYGSYFKTITTNDIEWMKKQKSLPKGTTILDIYKRTVYTATYNKEIKENWKIVRYREKNKAEGLKQITH